MSLEEKYTLETLESMDKQELLAVAEEIGIRDEVDGRSTHPKLVNQIYSMITLGVKETATEAVNEAEKTEPVFTYAERSESSESVKKPVASKTAGTRQPKIVRKGVVTPPMTSAQLRNQRKKEANELVRIVVVCMNPNKKALSGEVFTVSNSVVGTFRNYVPFGANEGWHVPRIIYNAMLERECQVFVRKKDRDNNDIDVPKLIKEFQITVLPPLTPEEIEELAKRQARNAMREGPED